MDRDVDTGVTDGAYRHYGMYKPIQIANMVLLDPGYRQYTAPEA